jgi:hypothetical protein
LINNATILPKISRQKIGKIFDQIGKFFDQIGKFFDQIGKIFDQILRPLLES